jgi:hypothetical protein
MTPGEGGDVGTAGKTGACSCVADPSSAVPVELRPRPKKRGSLRKVGCPSCGKEYWTNRQGDLCLDCEKASIR